MSRPDQARIDDLEPEFREKYLEVLERTERDGHELRCYFGVRDPRDQARLWRQSRTTREVEEKVEELAVRGAWFLRSCLVDVGPRHGPRVTNALPGLSWHQHGVAADHFVVDERGRAEWNADHPGYAAARRHAVDLGLGLGPPGDLGHLQGPPTEARVLDRYTWTGLDARMKARFGQGG